MKEFNLIKRTKFSLLYIGYTLKAVWYATYNIASLLVFVMGLGIMFLYLYDTGRIENINTYEQIRMVIVILFDYWKMFWLAFFGINLYENLKRLKVIR